MHCFVLLTWRHVRRSFLAHFDDREGRKVSEKPSIGLRHQSAEVEACAMSTYSEHDEWLEADGLGGFASGTASGIRTRRYHALLLAATTPPTGRMVLVNGFDAWVETPDGTRSR